MKPLVIQSYNHIIYEGVAYKRRLRISPFNVLKIDEILGTNIYYIKKKFIVLDDKDIKQVCNILEIPFKNIKTYLCIDGRMCSFRSVDNF